MYFVLCIVCCVVYCLLCITVLCYANNQMQKMFQRKLYYYVFCVALFVVLCIVCYVSQYCVVSTIKCKFFQQKFICFHKNIIFFSSKLLNVFSSVVSFTMSACSVRLMWPSLWWNCCVFGAVTPSFRWSRPSAGRWRPWVCHATNHKNFIYQPIFTIFPATNSAISRL